MSYANVEVMVDNGIYDKDDKDFIPHTFLKVTHPDGSVTYAGFPRSQRPRWECI